jgi:flagellin
VGIGVGRSRGSMFAERQLSAATADLSRSLERLSSGQRINRPSDDAAGLAVSESISVRTRVYTQAIRNANDAISALNIADGAGQNLSTIVTRLKELAEGAANGSFSRIQRLSLDTEATALTNEFNRIVGATTFNGRRLLDPANARFLFQLGFGTSESLGLDIGAGLSRNVASGSMTTGTTTASGNGGAVEADVNGDGIPDIIDFQLTFRVHVNNGSGGFTNTYNFDPGGGLVPQSVATGDFNNDGKLDFVASYGINSNRIFVGDGSGNFAPSTSLSALGVGQLAVGDFNSDGYDDIALSTGAGVNVYNGQAALAFSTSVSTSLGEATNSLNVGDFNGDGVDDLVVGGSTKVSVLKGQQGSTLALLTSYTTGTAVNQVLVGDVNHDGLLDIVAGSGSGSLKVLSQQSSGQLNLSTTISTFGDKAALKDYDGDGNLDIIDGAAGYNVYRGSETGSFASALNLGTGTFYNNASLIAADFNNDGVLDIFSSSSDPSTDYYLSNTQRTANIARLDLTTQSGARNALTSLENLLSKLGREQGSIGAGQSRLNSALSTLFSRVENYQAANSRIRSADIGEESANMVRLGILQQAATAVLSQANQSPNLVLQLLEPA